MDINALFSLSYGLYVLSVTNNGKDNGCIINAACQVTNVPNRICVAVNKENLTYRMITESGHFVINTLTEDTDIRFIGRFGFRSGTDIDKFAGLDFTRDAFGVPMLLDSTEVTAVVCCQVIGSADAGTHIIFIGELTDAYMTGYGTPMTYAYYHSVKQGKTPPKASGYQPSSPAAATKLESKENRAEKPRWRCKVCGYIHEGEEPPDICPVCSKDSSYFERLS